MFNSICLVLVSNSAHNRLRWAGERISSSLPPHSRLNRELPAATVIASLQLVDLPLADADHRQQRFIALSTGGDVLNGQVAVGGELPRRKHCLELFADSLMAGFIIGLSANPIRCCFRSRMRSSRIFASCSGVPPPNPLHWMVMTCGSRLPSSGGSFATSRASASARFLLPPRMPAHLALLGGAEIQFLVQPGVGGVGIGMQRVDEAAPLHP